MTGSTSQVDNARDEERAAQIAEEEGENFYAVLVDRFGLSRDEARKKYLDPYDPNPHPDLIEFLNDEVGCTNEELGLSAVGEPEDA